MFKIKMAISSFVLVLWVHVFLVGIIEISGDRNLKLLLSRNRREDPPAGNPTVSSGKSFVALEIIDGMQHAACCLTIFKYA